MISFIVLKIHKQNNFLCINISFKLSTFQPSLLPLCSQCKVEHADESVHKKEKLNERLSNITFNMVLKGNKKFPNRSLDCDIKLFDVSATTM
ncbi:fructose-1,6-bisphosphatase, chloroplastic [Trifolium repens]|nr:fructose-1,6-bisphosphatase, chloroplastic [Trifolium repens]